MFAYWRYKSVNVKLIIPWFHNAISHKLFTLYFIKYLPHDKLFQMKLTDCNVICTSHYVPVSSTTSHFSGNKILLLIKSRCYTRMMWAKIKFAWQLLMKTTKQSFIEICWVVSLTKCEERQTDMMTPSCIHFMNTIQIMYTTYKTIYNIYNKRHMIEHWVCSMDILNSWKCSFFRNKVHTWTLWHCMSDCVCVRILNTICSMVLCSSKIIRARSRRTWFLFTSSWLFSYSWAFRSPMPQNCR